MRPDLRLLILAAFGAALALPGAAEPLDGAAIAKALSDHRLRYPDQSSQIFRADGGTLYVSRIGTVSPGRWRVEGDLYCASWPPPDTWDCYAVEREGKVITFVAQDGSRSTGTIQ